MQTNHTPGPWAVAQRSVGKRQATVVLDADRNEVCEAYDSAALIAAAPELLAALQDARTMVYGMTGDAPASAPWNAMLPRIDAVISRATGDA